MRQCCPYPNATLTTLGSYGIPLPPTGTMKDFFLTCVLIIALGGILMAANPGAIYEYIETPSGNPQDSQDSQGDPYGQP
jgi:hypothetical protein